MLCIMKRYFSFSFLLRIFYGTIAEWRDPMLRTSTPAARKAASLLSSSTLSSILNIIYSEGERKLSFLIKCHTGKEKQ